MGLTSWVRQVLEEGIHLDPSLSDHLEATFGSTGWADTLADALSDILADPTNSESASFLELLFFPDIDTRLDFERRWGDHLFLDRDEAALIQSLLYSAVKAAIRMPDGSAFPDLQVPDFALTAFVRRLNMTWRPPAPLGAMLARVVSAEEMPPVRSRLRRLRLPWYPVQIELIERFLVRFPQVENDFETCFAFLASLLVEIRPDEDPFAFLLDKKHFFFQALCKAEHFEQLRQTSNMETLMLQGARNAHGNIAQWREQMRLMDRLCQLLYGQTRFFRKPAELALEGSGRSTDQQISDLVRILS